jgi:hypothetical protein
MVENPHPHDRKPEPDDLDAPIEPLDEDGEDEEIPTAVMVILLALVVGAVVLYLTLGGGHSHFH